MIRFLKQKKLVFAQLFLLLGLSSAFGSSLVFNNGHATIILEDHLNHPYYWWPRTLLSYPIVFNEKVSIKDLVLIDKKNGNSCPFQLTEIENTSDSKTKAVLYFMSDLPSNGTYEFVLKKGSATKYPIIKTEEKEGEILVQTDKLSVWFPTSQKSGSGILPGPIISIAQNG